METRSHATGFFDRVIVLVLDSVGIGAMPDADRFGDAGSDTLGHIAEHYPLDLPNLASLGLGNIRPLRGIEPAGSPAGFFGRVALASNGKDTTTGHWEMAGIILEKAFPTYPNGFPVRIIERFEKETGMPMIGNKAASGTEIIAELGAEHLRTGALIVYTSADSVFQIAAHEEIVPIETLYQYCAAARDLLQGDDLVGRVIARPFVGRPGAFSRTERRRDFAIAPPEPMLFDLLAGVGCPVYTVGKIASVFCYRNVTKEIKTKNNEDGINRTIETLDRHRDGFHFINLVDFDTVYGHRNDLPGYARALEHFDWRLPQILAQLDRRDLLIITADHGCDPHTPSTDHSREYVPLLAYAAAATASERSLGLRETLADIGATVAENFGVQLPAGKSFLGELFVQVAS